MTPEDKQYRQAIAQNSGDKEEFIRNYSGIYNPEHYWDYLEEVKRNNIEYKNATYSKETNERLLREANEKAFNKHLRNRD
jgi:hypothetical protein